ALVYVAVATGVVCVVLLAGSRRLVVPVGLGLATVVGLALPLVANQALERGTLGVNVRTQRVRGQASTGLGGQAKRDTAADNRRDEALVTTLGLAPDVRSGAFVVGAALVAVLAYGTVRA